MGGQRRDETAVSPRMAGFRILSSAVAASGLLRFKFTFQSAIDDTCPLRA